MSQAPCFSTESTQALSPLLKWAGGKRWLVPQLAQMTQGLVNRRLVEPFCGGLAVSLGLNPRHALLNDANPHLINFYRQVQHGLVITDPLENDRTFYFEARERFNALIREGVANTAEAAGLFYYLNRTGFNGLCRFNQKGLFNVPFGRYQTITYTRDFHPYQTRLAAWDLSLGDFETLPVVDGDWVYADPPYDVDFTSYAQGGFSWADQERLAQWLAALPCPVVASNQATPRIVTLYQDLGFRVETLPAPRRISCTGDRSAALEMLATRGFAND